MAHFVVVFPGLCGPTCIFWANLTPCSLKTRPKCEKAAREALRAGLTPVIDRTNVDPKQREAFLKVRRTGLRPGSRGSARRSG